MIPKNFNFQRMRVFVVVVLGVLMTCLAESHLRSSKTYQKKTLSKQDDEFKAFRERYVPRVVAFARKNITDARIYT